MPGSRRAAYELIPRSQQSTGSAVGPRGPPPRHSELSRLAAQHAHPKLISRSEAGPPEESLRRRGSSESSFSRLANGRGGATGRPRLAFTSARRSRASRRGRLCPQAATGAVSSALAVTAACAVSGTVEAGTGRRRDRSFCVNAGVLLGDRGALVQPGTHLIGERHRRVVVHEVPRPIDQLK
jgi:hypothetical protein